MQKEGRKCMCMILSVFFAPYYLLVNYYSLCSWRTKPTQPSDLVSTFYSKHIQFLASWGDVKVERTSFAFTLCQQHNRCLLVRVCSSFLSTWKFHPNVHPYLKCRMLLTLHSVCVGRITRTYDGNSRRILSLSVKKVVRVTSVWTSNNHVCSSILFGSCGFGRFFGEGYVLPWEAYKRSKAVWSYTIIMWKTVSTCC